MTVSSLTAYNSNKHREVYTYDAGTGALRCASCNPSGAAPTQAPEGVSVAEAGSFMSDDGRAFFATKESLVPQDTNGIRDIYEYTDGRAQLISSGTGDRESTGGLEVASAFFGDLQTSLESVSRDGTDVYFSTFESLVPQDKNGSFLKFYDARVGGGFDVIPDLGPCAAADECHGDREHARSAGPDRDGRKPRRVRQPHPGETEKEEEEEEEEAEQPAQETSQQEPRGAAAMVDARRDTDDDEDEDRDRARAFPRAGCVGRRSCMWSGRRTRLRRHQRLHDGTEQHTGRRTSGRQHQDGVGQQPLQNGGSAPQH